MVHHILEGGGGVGQPKWHDLELEKPVPGSERGFPLISFSDSDQVKPIFKVHLREPLRPLDSIL